MENHRTTSGQRNATTTKQLAQNNPQKRNNHIIDSWWILNTLTRSIRISIQFHLNRIDLLMLSRDWPAGSVIIVCKWARTFRPACNSRKQFASFFLSFKLETNCRMKQLKTVFKWTAGAKQANGRVDFCRQVALVTRPPASAPSFSNEFGFSLWSLFEPTTCFLSNRVFFHAPSFYPAALWRYLSY